eukprot:4746981-Pleurochrysis_carterae.AAC.1
MFNLKSWGLQPVNAICCVDDIDAPPDETAKKARFTYTHVDAMPVLVVANTNLKARSRMNSIEMK